MIARARDRARAGAVTAAAVVAALAATAPAQSQETPPPGAEWRLETLDGSEVALSDLTGRPLVLNFWATWCAPCVAELRSLERLAASLDGRDVTFAMVSPQDREAVATWVRRRGYRLPFYVEGSRIPAAFGLEAVPTTWVLDAGGRVVLKHRGSVDWDRDDVRALLLGLTAASDPDA